MSTALTPIPISPTNTYIIYPTTTSIITSPENKNQNKNSKKDTKKDTNKIPTDSPRQFTNLQYTSNNNSGNYNNNNHHTYGKNGSDHSSSPLEITTTNASTSRPPLPNNTAFQQQKLKAWQPTLPPRYVVLTYIFLGIIFIPVGVGLIVASNQLVEVRQRYDDLGPSVPVQITEDMTLPVYVYYELTNYYQNHRRYVASRSDEQLYGEDDPDLSKCDPSYYKRFEGENMYPCGIIASSFFNDTFSATLQRGSDSVILGNTTSNDPSFSSDGIAYSKDTDERFRYHFYNGTSLVGPNGPLPNVTDPDFAVWMRVAALPTFKKLYRIIKEIPNPTFDNQLRAGDVVVFNIQNVYPVNGFDGEKRIVLATTNAIGGKNVFLGWAWVAVGIACFIMAALFAAKTILSPPDKTDLKLFETSKIGGRFADHSY